MTHQIYVASLADYNAGKLHGEWITLDNKSVEDVYNEIQTILNTSIECYTNEWAIHDYELPFEISENEDIETLLNNLNVFNTFDENKKSAVLSFVSNYEIELSEALNIIDNHYIGTFENDKQAGFYMINELSSLKLDDFLKQYFDYNKYINDKVLSGYIEKIGNHYFYSL